MSPERSCTPLLSAEQNRLQGFSASGAERFLQPCSQAAGRSRLLQSEYPVTARFWCGRGLACLLLTTVLALC